MIFFIFTIISQILDLKSVLLWNHVRTEDNPANAASEGLLPCELQDSRIWWNGPQWLEKEQKEWVQSLVQA